MLENSVVWYNDIVIMEIPASRWFDAILKRRSRRRFDNKPLEKEHLEQMNYVCREFHPFQHARAILVTESSDKVFKGIIGSFGKVKNAPAFIAFIGNMESSYVQEQVGYTGEGIILEAQALGLSTCWVGGFFKKRVVQSLIEINNTEKVIAVTPVGYAVKNLAFEEKLMTGFGRTHKRKELPMMVTGMNDAKRPEWINKALDAARLAPSAVNRQPWLFHVEYDGITVLVNSTKQGYGLSKRLDCGIAMLHIEVAALSCGVSGQWQFLEHPSVARFIIK